MRDSRREPLLLISECSRGLCFVPHDAHRHLGKLRPLSQRECECLSVALRDPRMSPCPPSCMIMALQTDDKHNLNRQMECTMPSLQKIAEDRDAEK